MKRKIILSATLLALLGVVACKATRAGYESASYVTKDKTQAFEIREYPELAVASVGSNDRKEDGQFMQLFGYITGKNEGQQKIAMTTPVFMDEKDRSRMSFVLPKELTANTAPKPQSDKVRLGKLPARKMAVLRFNGRSGREAENKNLEKLRQWMTEQKLTATGEPVVA